MPPQPFFAAGHFPALLNDDKQEDNGGNGTHPVEAKEEPHPPSHFDGEMTNEHAGQGQEREDDDSGEHVFHNADLIHLAEQERYDKSRHQEGHVACIIAVQAECAVGNTDELEENGQAGHLQIEY